MSRLFLADAVEMLFAAHEELAVGDGYGSIDWLAKRVGADDFIFGPV
jgi:hypothetical protein